MILSGKTITAWLLLLLAIQVSAQDERAHIYMQGVSDQFSLDEGFLIEMDYIREDIMRETSAEGEGTIWMKGVKYRIVVDDYIVSYDGDKLYSHNTEAEEVYVSTPDPDDPGYLQAVPIRIIKSYQQDFKYQYMGYRPFLGKDRIEIQLYPKNASGPYSMLKMFVHPTTLKLEGFILKHKEGINYTMILSKVTGNQELEESTFRFDPQAYPNTEVIELLE